ncbi:MAG TPA: hypothetical protein PKM73_07205 [Verrucomicrobiota bacterium]|nr:hypothetical protein [Verrucomicrobiota bacterium]HNU50150.1 hypothetical protein [Verrucomicrobiota bacterium]
MPTQIALGHIEAHEKLTARLFVQPSSESGYIDCGNVADYKHAPEKQYKTRMVAEGGFRRVNDEQLDTVHDRWEFTLDEMDVFNHRLLHLAQSPASVSQAAATAPAGTASITGIKKGRCYFAGAVGLNTVVVKKGVTTLVEGTDYTIDLNTGVLTILATGSTLTDGDDISLTFGNAAQTFESYTANSQVLFRGAVRILETNQFSGVPLREISFTGCLTVTAWPEQTGEFGKYTVRATPTSAPTIKRRYQP